MLLLDQIACGESLGGIVWQKFGREPEMGGGVRDREGVEDLEDGWTHPHAIKFCLIYTLQEDFYGFQPLWVQIQYSNPVIIYNGYTRGCPVFSIPPMNQTTKNPLN